MKSPKKPGSRNRFTRFMRPAESGTLCIYLIGFSCKRKSAVNEAKQVHLGSSRVSKTTSRSGGADGGRITRTEWFSSENQPVALIS